MFFNIKKVILLKIVWFQYRVRIYFSNLAVENAFREGRRIPYSVIAVTVFLLFATATISLGSIYRGNDMLGIMSILKEDKGSQFVEEVPKLEPYVDKEPIELLRATYKIVVDKKQRVMFVVDKNYLIREKFSILIGEKGGDKEQEGDLKTPKGLYKIIEIKEDKDLPDMYGPYAFVLDYPNEVDQRGGKTGSNIWIHGKGGQEDKRFTKGCIALDDNIILRLNKYINKDTEVYIYPYGFEVPTNGNVVSKSVVSGSFLYNIGSKVSG